MAYPSTSTGTEILASKSRTPTNPEKHKIFLCHSGAQKNFVRYLDRELRRVHQYAFFDEDDGSLRKGEVFPDQLFEAAAQCQLAIVILSEDFFTRSKWPMLELDIFLKEKKQILPLYYDLTTSELKDETRHAEWFRKWEEWSEQGSHTIDLEVWKENLKALFPLYGLERSRFDNNEVKFIDEIVAVVCKLVPSGGKWDDSHVRGKEFLLSEIDRLFAKCPPSNTFGARVLGLYGIGGLGKSLLCNCLCNHYYAKYVGKVAVMKLPGHGLDKAKTEEYIRHVMKILTGARDELLTSFYDKEKGFNMLNERIPRCDVFLAIDNVWDDLESQEVATSFLQLRFNSASRILVTARNRQTLLNLGIDEMCCFGMPTIPEKDAIELFLHYARLSQTMANLSPELQIYVQQHVYQCYFLNGATKEFHPFALKVLGVRCAQIINTPTRTPWLKVVELTSSNDATRAVFDILRTSYEALPDEEYRQKFMDIALFYRDEMVMYHWPIEISATKLLEWLMLFYEEDPEQILEQIEFLKSNFLFEMADGNGFRVHDLYLEFAKHEAQKRGSEGQRCFSIDCSTAGISGLPRFMTVPRPYLPWPFKRLYVSNVSQGWSKLELKYSSNLELLHLENLDVQIGELGLSGLFCLRHLRLVRCKFKAVCGLPDLPYLVRMDLVLVNILEPISSNAIILQQLQHLHLDSSKLLNEGNWSCPSLRAMLVHNCDEFWPVVEGENLQSLSVTHCFTYNSISLEDFPNLQEIQMDCVPAAEQLKPLHDGSRHLRNLFYFGSNSTGKQIIGLESMRHLRELSLHAMLELNALDGIQNCAGLLKFSVSSCSKLLFFSTQPIHWTYLQELRIYHCGKLEVVNIGPLPALKKLSIVLCRELRQLPDLTNSPGLQKCIISDCGNKVDSLDTTEFLPFLEEFKSSMCLGLKTLAKMGSQPSLKSFNIYGCSELVEIPDLTDSQALEVYKVMHCGNLQTICRLGLLPALKSFTVENCNRLEKLPDLIDSHSLEVYEVQSCKNLQTLGKLGPVPALRSFKVERCNRLVSLPDLMDSQALEEYHVRDCDNLQILGKLGPVPALRSFKLERCHRDLVELPDLTDSQALEEYEVQCSSDMEVLLKLGPVPALRSFKVKGLKGLLELPNLQVCQALEEFEVRYLEKLETLNKLDFVPALRSFKLERCNTLVKVPDLMDPQLLEEYEVRLCENLQSLGNLGPVPALKSFKVEGCKKLVALPELMDPQLLEEYEVRLCENLQSLGNLGPVPALKSFKVEGCKKLVALPELIDPQVLKEYAVRLCENLQSLGKLGPVPALRTFKVEGCNKLVVLPGLLDPQVLEEYEVRCCEKLQNLGKLGPAPGLKSFKIARCTSLVKICYLEHTEALTIFEVSRCPSLKYMGNLNVKVLKVVECPALIKLFTKTRAELVKVWKLEREAELWAQESRLQAEYWGPNWRQIIGGSSLDEIHGSDWREKYPHLLDIQ